jgi:hypothetical protein
MPRWRQSFNRAYPPRLVRQTRAVSNFTRGPRRSAYPQYLALCDRRAAATLLGARMFQLDQGGGGGGGGGGGELPSRWDQLVPAYLPHVPADPFGYGDAPLRLVRRYSDTIVYSVGKDFADDGGADLDEKRRPVYPGFRPNTIDLVYHFRPPAVATTTTTTTTSPITR